MPVVNIGVFPISNLSLRKQILMCFVKGVHILCLRLAPLISLRFLTSSWSCFHMLEKDTSRNSLCYWRLMEVRIWRCNMHTWIFLTSDLFLWCIVWFCESLNQPYKGHLSSSPQAVGLAFPVRFLCLLVNWSRKLNQQKHCNLANIFADSMNTAGWFLG